MSEVDSYSFDCTGVAILRQVVPQNVVEEVRNRLRENWPNGTPWKFPVLHLGRVFWRLMTHPKLLELSREYAGDQFRVDHVFGVSSNGATAQLHGGPESSQYSCFYHMLSGGKRKGLASQLNFGFTIDGQTPQTGGFCYIPGSHKAADARAGREVLSQVYKGNFSHPSIVVPQLNPGDAVFFTEALVHGDTGWKAASGQRTQIYYRTTPGFLCWRDPRQNEHLLQYAETQLERRLMEPPWTGRFSEDQTSMGVSNERRSPTL